MKKVLFVISAILFLNLELEAKSFVKSLVVGETWIGYATTHLEVEYVRISDLLLIKNPFLKTNYPLTDSIDANSLTADIMKLRRRCYVKKTKSKELEQLVLSIIANKEHLPSGSFYMEFDDETCAFLGRESSSTDWFLYWDGKTYSVERKYAESFRDKYTAISMKKIQEDIQNTWKEIQEDIRRVTGTGSATHTR